MTQDSQATTTVFFQEACLSHRFIRSRDTSAIVERPQRLKAVKAGVAAAIARLEEIRGKNSDTVAQGAPDPDDVLASALERLKISDGRAATVNVAMSTVSVDLLSHPAVKYVHGDIDGDVYLERLVTLIRESEEKVARGESEIPDGLSQGDLYLCKESLDAIQGAVGAVCEAVDTVLRTTGLPLKISPETSVNNESTFAHIESSRAFVAIRPPGHHCGEDTPSGFCFLNNVAIGAAHAHLQHDITRVVILDIDLHHGNGTQSIAWQINEETYRQELESEASKMSGKPGLKMYYGSIHDVLSYPCEDGKAALIQAASVSLHGPHGQHIENVHLLPYESDEDFWDRLYAGPYTRLLHKAEAFLKEELSGEAIVFISAGFDASEHEDSSMSRHGRKVPTGFYHRFARDVRKLADKYAKGRIVSVLEGGYSDRALCSGAMAHVLGLAEEGLEVDASWWSLDNLIKIEKNSKRQRGGRTSGVTPPEKWVERTISILSTLCCTPSPPPTPKHIPPSTMTLRDRNKKTITPSTSMSTSGTPPPNSGLAAAGSKDGSHSVAVTHGEKLEDEKHETLNAGTTKKLPKVFLRVNPPTSTATPSNE